MRKYQQLLLLVLSCISIIVLFIYKSENNRLKYVLQVVNFFGRKDAAFIGQFENITNDNLDFSHRLPIWQALDSSFHAYAAYWLQDTLTSGEALAEVAGKAKENVLFHCTIKFEDGTTQEGKFRFQPWEHTAENSAEFKMYSFYCGLNAMKSNSQAESVLFISKSIKIYGTELRLRKMEINKPEKAIEVATICLDLTNHLMPLRNFYKNSKNMLQFFLHHKALGVNHFLVYNSDVLSTNLMRVLRQALIQIHPMPFNFPFATTKDTAEQLRQIIRVNCMRRSAPAANYTILLSANEFLYAKTRLDSKSAIIGPSHDKHYRIGRVNVCLNPQKTLLIDNMAYDASQSVIEDNVIYSLQGLNIKDTTALLNLPQTSHVTHILRDQAYMHSYVDCVNIGSNGLDNWRSELKEDFLNYLKAERSEMTMFIK